MSEQKKETNWKLSLASLLLGAALVLTGWATSLLQTKTPNNLSGVNRGNEYHATTTKNTAGLNNLANLQVIQTGSGTLGSVVITGATTGIITFYDATNTVNNTLWATTTIAQIPASLAAGTYTFDAVFTKGLLMEFSGSLPTSTITVR